MKPYLQVIDYLEDNGQFWKSRVVKDLVLDSELLEGLTEMGQRKGIVVLSTIYNVFYVEYWDNSQHRDCRDPSIDIGRETPRKAIEAAVKEWKKGK